HLPGAGALGGPVGLHLLRGGLLGEVRPPGGGGPVRRGSGRRDDRVAPRREGGGRALRSEAAAEEGLRHARRRRAPSSALTSRGDDRADLPGGWPDQSPARAIPVAMASRLPTPSCGSPAPCSLVATCNSRGVAAEAL